VKRAHAARLASAARESAAAAAQPNARCGAAVLPARNSLWAMALTPGILARGPWTLDQVRADWREQPYEPPSAANAEADAAITALRARGSPAHDGISARLAGHRSDPGGLVLELEPARWALRLNDSDAAQSLAAMCVVRSSDGRWLAGHRADWLATWAGRWALGAGGAVDSGENPADTLARELREEWSVSTERITVEALVCLPHQLVLLVGLAWLAAGAQVVPDAEHDAFAWWPAEVDRWPPEADAPLRQTAIMLTGP
jgi:8-oxo-dGTP diphosphatase